MQLIYEYQLFLVHTGLAGTGYAVEQSITYQLEAGCTVCNKVQISTLTISNAYRYRQKQDIQCMQQSPDINVNNFYNAICIARSRICDGVFRESSSCISEAW